MGLLAAAVAAFALAPGAQARSLGGPVPDVPTGAHLHQHQPPVAHAAAVFYGGGSVLHWNRTHLIFWSPAGSGLSFDPGYESLMEAFLKNVAADSHMTTNEYGLTGQYTDSGGPAAYNSTYGGDVIDTDRLPPSDCVEPSTAPPWNVCLSDADLETEIERVVSDQRLPSTGNDIYFLVTPSGLGDCENSGPTDCALGGSTDGSYCGYHFVTPNGIVYAVIPYNAVPGHCQSDNPRPNSSTADPALSTLSHEQIEAITDPDGDAWTDPSGMEIADLCITNYGPNLGGSGNGAWDEVINGSHYYLQEIWSNYNSACEPRAAADRVSFSSVRHPAAGTPDTFTAKASDPHGTIIAYDWFFGDGRSGHGRKLAHTFSRSGSYRVVLRVTDSADNWAYAVQTIGIGRAADHRGQP